MTIPKIKNKQYSLEIFGTIDEVLQVLKILGLGECAGVFSLYTSRKVFSLRTTKKNKILCYVGQSKHIFGELKKYEKKVPHNPDFVITKGIPLLVKIHKIWSSSEFEKLKRKFQGSGGTFLNYIEKEFVKMETKEGFIVVNKTHTGERKKLHEKTARRKKRLKKAIKSNKKSSLLTKPVIAYRPEKTKNRKYKIKNGELVLQEVERFESLDEAKECYNDNVGISLKIPFDLQCKMKNPVLVKGCVFDYARERDRKKRDQKFKGSEDSKIYRQSCKEGKTFYAKLAELKKKRMMSIPSFSIDKYLSY